MTIKKEFTLKIDDWRGNAKNTLVQGLNVHPPTGTLIGHQADDVPGQSRQDVVFRQHKPNGDYIGAITVKNGGHGSSTGLETVDGNTVRIWFGHDGYGCSGYVQFNIGETGIKDFVKTDLPEGDIEIDQANNRLVLRNNDSRRNSDRYRVYDFNTVKAEGAHHRDKLADFYVPHWGRRWQGMYVAEGRLFVHRDVKTKGASRAQMFDLKGKFLDDWDTTKMGDEAEGFFSTSDGNNVAIFAVKRTGPAGPRRIIEGTWLVSIPKVRAEAPWDGKSFPGPENFRIGSNHPAVTVLGERLVAHGWTGYKSGPGVPMSSTDQEGVEWFQKKQGWSGSDADGIPGPETWKRLMAAPDKPDPKPDPEPEKPVSDLPAYYPPADRTAQWFPSIAGSGTIDRVDKLVLHTTEGGGWFNYASVGYGPHLTYNPRTREWRQHISLHKSATALSNDGSYKTNQANAIQIEIIGYSKNSPEWLDTTVEDIGALVKWLSQYGLQIRAPKAFTPYPPGLNVRMTRSAYQSCRGVIGHQHVPGNNHGDPGLPPIDKILAAAKGKPIVVPPPTTPPTDNPVPATSYKVPSPVKNGVLGYAFGVRDSGYAAGRHTGQDYKASTGTSVVAVWSGVVQRKPFDGDGYGTYIVLKADNGRDYYYCHLSDVTVSNGERVIPGQIIGKVGSTGNSTGPHLHFEDRPRGGGYNNVRKPDWPTWDGKSFVRAFVIGESYPAVTLLGQRLVAHLGKDIYEDGPGPKFTDTDKAAVKKFQEKQGWSGSDADGIPGPETWRRLMKPKLSS